MAILTKEQFMESNKKEQQALEATDDITDQRAGSQTGTGDAHFGSGIVSARCGRVQYVHVQRSMLPCRGVPEPALTYRLRQPRLVHTALTDCQGATSWHI
jgi:hypothetical protein